MAMIETSNPEIEVDKLMEQVKAEAARSTAIGQASAQPAARTRTRRSAFPALPKPAAAPSVAFSQPTDSKKSRTEEKLENARVMITVSSAIPAPFIFQTEGFADLQLKCLSPVDTTHVAGSAELPAVLKDLLYGPQDFAVIGRKPGPR